MPVMVQVSELHHSTDDGIKVLEDIHLHIDRGELVYVVGPASSGKSLLFGLIGAQTPPQQGQILVYGRNVARLSRSKSLELRRKIGFLPQGFVPLPRTVQENVAFKLRAMGNFREQAEEKAVLALEMVGLLREQTADATELDSIDRLRLGLALATCDDPLVLILDDPFNGLDADEQREICVLLDRIHAGQLTILASARGPLPALAHEHRIVRLVDGRMVER